MSSVRKEYPQSYYGLLAVLSLGPRTGYGIRKEFEHPEVFYWKESYGNIYPMLRHLEKDGLVTRHESYVKKKRRLVYRLNESGWSELTRWLQVPAALNRFRIEILMKIRFGESGGVANMISQVEHYRKTASDELSEAKNNSGKLREQGDTLSGDLRLVTSVFLEELKESSIRWCDRAMEILRKWEGRELEPVNSLKEVTGDVSFFQVPRREPPLIE